MITGILVCILLVMIFGVYEFGKFLEAIATNVSEVNAQLQVFIQGVGSVQELRKEDLDSHFLSVHKLLTWSNLGRCFSENQYHRRKEARQTEA